jgi:integral membrane protein
VNDAKPDSGAHQVLLALYALFALAAGARSTVQLATKADEALAAYLLSLAAALTYAVGWVAIRRAADGRTRLASVTLWIEIAGVLTVGTMSLLEEEWFPDATVWSEYGIGYGFVPLVLPLAGLFWLRARVSGFGLVMAFRVLAAAEAVSWAGLLAGMYAKYVADVGPGGVQVFGPIHGTIFIGYVLVALLTWRQQRWSFVVGLAALAASIPPFATLAFELFAARTGRLAVTGRRSSQKLEPVLD